MTRKVHHDLWLKWRKPKENWHSVPYTKAQAKAEAKGLCELKPGMRKK